jgi:hypothetical protein
MPSSRLASPPDVPFSWRVTKYDPALRDQRGRYLHDTWTSIADIGTFYNGEQLTIEAYDRVEASYLRAARAFADEQASPNSKSARSTTARPTSRMARSP